MTAEIRQNEAKYYINGDLYAEASYQEGDVPHRGYFGFAIYNSEDKTIKDVRVTELSDASTANGTASATTFDNSTDQNTKLSILPNLTFEPKFIDISNINQED